MEKIKIFTKVKNFERFVNNVEVIYVKVQAFEPSYQFQEGFLGIVFYEDGAQKLEEENL